MVNTSRKQPAPEGKKVLNHPQVGSLAFKHLMFQMYDEPDLKVIVYTPLTEGDTAAKIHQLVACRRASADRPV